MLSPVIVKLLEDKMQKSIRYASDYDYLSYDIEKSTGKNISTNTLKRLLGYMEGVKAPRLYTLDVVAEYLGYVDWDDLNQKVLSNDSSSSFSTIEEIDIQHLIPSDKVRFTYLPEREVTVELIEGNTFTVVESVNSKLREGDIIQINHFVLNHPLIVTNVIREGVSMGRFTAGKHSGIISLTIL